MDDQPEKDFSLIVMAVQILIIVASITILSLMAAGLIPKQEGTMKCYETTIYELEPADSLLVTPQESGKLSIHDGGADGHGFTVRMRQEQAASLVDKLTGALAVFNRKKLVA